MSAVEPAAKAAVTPLGRLEAESATLPENDPTPAIAMVLVPLPPWGTATAAGEADRVKPGTTLTAKLCTTGVAAAYVLLPAWAAWMVQVPTAIKEAVLPETVQLFVVCELKLTGRPEEDDAARVTCVPTVCAPGFAKAMVCGSAVTVKLCVTAAAACQLLSPGCVA